MSIRLPETCSGGCFDKPNQGAAVVSEGIRRV